MSTRIFRQAGAAPIRGSARRVFSRGFASDSRRFASLGCISRGQWCMTHARSNALRTAIGLTLSLIASPGLGRQEARFEITPDTVLIDERFRVALDGLEPRKDITIRVEGNRGVWQSSATFRSDDRGHLEVADPMRLIWSASGDRQPAGVAGPFAPQWTFTAEADGRVIVTRTILRRAVAEN